MTSILDPLNPIHRSNTQLHNDPPNVDHVDPNEKLNAELPPAIEDLTGRALSMDTGKANDVGNRVLNGQGTNLGLVFTQLVMLKEEEANRNLYTRQGSVRKLTGAIQELSKLRAEIQSDPKDPSAPCVLSTKARICIAKLKAQGIEIDGLTDRTLEPNTKFSEAEIKKAQHCIDNATQNLNHQITENSQAITVRTELLRAVYACARETNKNWVDHHQNLLRRMVS